MANTRDIKKRIKSIGNTKKITRAMEMVSAAKMRRAIEAVLKTRPYANLSWQTVLDLVKAGARKNEQASHPLLITRNEIKKTAIILITANRGLCGGFNSNIIRKAVETVKSNPPNPLYPADAEALAGRQGGKMSSPLEGERKGEVNCEFILLGKKGQVINKNFGLEVAADFPKLDYINEVREVRPLAGMIIKDYLDGKYDRVVLAYTDFINAAKQLPRIKQILPIEIEKMDEDLGSVGAKAETAAGVTSEALNPPFRQLADPLFPPKADPPLAEKGVEYVFEPSPEEVLNEMLPRLIEIQLYQALLESNASEQSARRLAMHQATEAAGDMVCELTLSYNKARQAGVTLEIAEISAGANALQE